MNRFLLTIFFCLIFGNLALAQSSLIISQYVETNSGTVPKGIELWNISGADITLSATNVLEVYKGTNGGALSLDASVNTGTILAGDVFVIGTSDMSPDFVKAFTFNGDDALEIRLNGVVQDVFGTPGSDPGSAWSGGGVSTANQNIAVISGICDGDLDGWTDPSTRFEMIGAGTDLTGFGVAPTHTCSPVTADRLEFTSIPSGGYETPETFDLQVCATDGTAIETGYSGGITLTQTLGATASVSPASPATPVGGCVTFTITPADDADPYDIAFDATSGALTMASTGNITIYAVQSCPLEGDLIITEFMANPGDIGDTEGEYIELYNRSASTIDINGWELRDNATQSITLDNGGPMLIAPGTFFVLGNSASVPNVDFVYDGSGFSLANATDEATIRCPFTGGLPLKICSVQYVDGDQFGSGTANELLCLQILDACTTDEDYVPATDMINYDADADTDFGSPGAAGNTETAIVTPTMLAFTTVPVSAGSGTTFELEVCATDGSKIPCDYATDITLTQTAGTAATIVTSPATPDNGCVVFMVTAPTVTACEDMAFTAASTGLTDALTGNIAVKEVLNAEDFSACPTTAWTPNSVSGAEVWTCDGTGFYADMNGFPNVNEDWLISPAFNLDCYTNEILNFNTRERYDGPVLELLWSSDYAGTGDPNAATWTALTFAYDNSTFSGGAFNPWTNSGDIDISAITGTAVYFAFKYTADATSSQWRVDDIQILGCSIPCSITAINVSNISACNPADNTFTADVEVVFTKGASTGNLVLSGDASATVSVASVSGTSHTFTGVSFNSDGNLKELTATFDGAPSACTFTEMDIAGTDVATCDPTAAKVEAGLMINEVFSDQTFSGPTCFGNYAFIELLVVASLEDSTTINANVEEWIIEPSTGNAGHLRIKSGCLTNVPVGSLIVIYNADNPGALTADETDTNADLVYFLPSNSSCLEFTSATSYPGPSYSDPGASCAGYSDQLTFLFAGNVVQTRHPHAFSRVYSNIYDQMTYNPTAPGTESQSFTCGNIDDATIEISLTATPGLPNNGDNGDMITQIRIEAGNNPTAGAGTPDPTAFLYFEFLTPGRTPGCNTGALPVEMISFNATAKARTVELDWATSSEINNSHFSVERSRNGVDFREIGMLRGAGDSSIEQYYVFTDESPFLGLNYYRLKQVDFDGSFEYSSVQTARIDVDKKLFEVIPTITFDHIKINFLNDGDKAKFVNIFDVSGRTILHQSVADKESLSHTIDVRHLPAGTYILQVQTVSGLRASERFVVQK